MCRDRKRSFRTPALSTNFVSLIAQCIYNLAKWEDSWFNAEQSSLFQIVGPLLPMMLTVPLLLYYCVLYCRSNYWAQRKKQEKIKAIKIHLSISPPHFSAAPISFPPLWIGFSNRVVDFIWASARPHRPSPRQCLLPTNLATPRRPRRARSLCPGGAPAPRTTATAQTRSKPAANKGG